MLSNLKEEEKLDPRVKRTRGLILESFESLIAEKGFEIHLRAGCDRQGADQPRHFLRALRG